MRSVEDAGQWLEDSMADEAQGGGSTQLIIYQDNIAGAIGIHRVDRLYNSAGLAIGWPRTFKDKES